MWNASVVTVSYFDTSRNRANPPRNRKDDCLNIQAFNPGIVAP